MPQEISYEEYIHGLCPASAGDAPGFKVKTNPKAMCMTLCDYTNFTCAGERLVLDYGWGSKDGKSRQIGHKCGDSGRGGKNWWRTNQTVGCDCVDFYEAVEGTVGSRSSCRHFNDVYKIPHVLYSSLFAAIFLFLAVKCAREIIIEGKKPTAEQVRERCIIYFYSQLSTNYLTPRSSKNPSL